MHARGYGNQYHQERVEMDWACDVEGLGQPFTGPRMKKERTGDREQSGEEQWKVR